MKSSLENGANWCQNQPLEKKQMEEVAVVLTSQIRETLQKLRAQRGISKKKLLGLLMEEKSLIQRKN